VHIDQRHGEQLTCAESLPKQPLATIGGT